MNRLRLKQVLSAKTTGRLRSYIEAFGRGAHRVVRKDGRAFIELEEPDDARLVHHQFPDLLQVEKPPQVKRPAG